jgi:hypothetical protein
MCFLLGIRRIPVGWMAKEELLGQFFVRIVIFFFSLRPVLPEMGLFIGFFEVF